MRRRRTPWPLGATSHTPTLAFPVARLGLILVVAVAAGLLASVLPARRAVGLSPAAALGEDWACVR
ncbi:MAG: hypothetical protein M3O94_00285 [Actinomycetota bacterium]|nr:hypothetical protein [Actinomycetota bacterium]